MADTGENFAAFNSRALVEMVGGVTDEALKVTRIKQFLSVLAGRFFNWAGRKSLFTLHLGIKCCAIEMAAAATGASAPQGPAVPEVAKSDSSASSELAGEVAERDVKIRELQDNLTKVQQMLLIFNQRLVAVEGKTASADSAAGSNPDSQKRARLE